MGKLCDVWNDVLESLKCRECDGVRIVPVLGPVRSAPASVPKTPQFRRFPLLGEVIMAFDLTIDQQVSVAVKAVDKKGNPAKVQDPTWNTDNTDVLALTPSDDGMSCNVVAVGMVGTATLQFSADADMGDGVKPILGTLEVNVTAGEAVTVTLEPGTPTNQ